MGCVEIEREMLSFIGASQITGTREINASVLSPRRPAVVRRGKSRPRSD